jgi:Tol biopolymer transport system component
MHRSAIVLLATLLASCATPATTPALPSSAPTTPATAAPSDSHPNPSPSSASPSPAPTFASGIEGQLAYVAGLDPQIHLLDLATGESRQLTALRPEHAELSAFGPMRPALSCAFGPYGLAWSPDGEYLAFSYGSCESVVYVVDLDGELRRIGDGGGPAWSPDGTRLVHAVNVPYSPCGAGCLPEPEPGTWDLRVIDLADDGESRPLTVDGSTAAASSTIWSPDGSTIAYSAPPPPGAGSPGTYGATYLIDASGGEPRFVGAGAYPMGWHPDGRLVVRMESDSSVRVVDLETGLSTGLGPPETSTVSPDGSLVVSSGFDATTGASRAMLLDATGTTVAEVGVHALAWAPDSSLLATLEDSAILIVGRDGARLASYPINAEGAFGPGAWRPGS